MEISYWNFDFDKFHISRKLVVNQKELIRINIENIFDEIILDTAVISYSLVPIKNVFFFLFN